MSELDVTYKEGLEYFPKKITEIADTPCYIISEKSIRHNCEILDNVQKRTGVNILLALKAFAMPKIFPAIAEYLYGVCASGPIEAQIGREEFGREVHTFSPAFSEKHMTETLRFSDHIVLNSIYQHNKYKEIIRSSGKEIGIRVNPGYSEVETALYDPCAPFSRFGVSAEEIEKADFNYIDGLHFHAMCEQNSDVLARILESFERNFGKYIHKLKWVNFGGGHHITKRGYDIDLLCSTINNFRNRYNNIKVYLEPGEAVVLNSGALVSTVLDIMNNGMDIAIMDTSAETHMPDVLAMPYRPNIIDAGKAGEFPYTYRLGGVSCLAGDVIGDYSFKSPLKRGDKLVFLDMALYSFVKNTSFNGIELPSLYLVDNDMELQLVRKFGYEDYKSKL